MSECICRFHNFQLIPIPNADNATNCYIALSIGTPIMKKEVSQHSNKFFSCMNKRILCASIVESTRESIDFIADATANQPDQLNMVGVSRQRLLSTRYKLLFDLTSPIQKMN